MDALVAEYRRLEQNLQNATEERNILAIYSRMQILAAKIFNNS